MNLQGKKILITGASSGIGKATAEMAAKAGAVVVLTARREDLLKTIVEQIEGINNLFYAGDVTDESFLTTLLHDATLDQVPFDGFVHSAGTEVTMPLKLLSKVSLEKGMNVNALAAFSISRLLMQKGKFNSGGGSIVFINSVMGSLGQPAKVGYCATKGALLAGARAMALELAPKKIRVNSVQPGMVTTAMSINLLNQLDDVGKNRIESMHPLGLGTAEDVAHAAIFLLSDQAKWITGTSFVVDGGYSAQ